MTKKTTTKVARTKKLAKALFGNPFIKDDWADYAVPHLKPKYMVRRFDDKKDNRFYFFKEGEETVIGAGVTTVIERVLPYEERRHIDKWKDNNPNRRHLLRISAEYGTLEHIVQGEILFKKGVDKAKLETMQNIAVDNGGSVNMPSKDILAFMKFQEDYQLIPLLIEGTLAWQDPDTKEWLCLTIDLLAKLVVTNKIKTQVEDGVYQRGDKKGEVRYKDVVTEEQSEKIVVVDFKGNFFDKDKKDFYESNKCQLQAAKLAVEQNFNIKVDDVYNYAPSNWRTTPSYAFYKWNLTQLDWDIFFSYWRTAYLKGYNKPVGNMLVTEGFKDSSDYKFLSYREYVEQVLMKETAV